MTSSSIKLIYKDEELKQSIISVIVLRFLLTQL